MVRLIGHENQYSIRLNLSWTAVHLIKNKSTKTIIENNYYKTNYYRFAWFS